MQQRLIQRVDDQSDSETVFHICNENPFSCPASKIIFIGIILSLSVHAQKTGCEVLLGDFVATIIKSYSDLCNGFAIVYFGLNIISQSNTCIQIFTN